MFRFDIDLKVWLFSRTVGWSCSCRRCEEVKTFSSSWDTVALQCRFSFWPRVQCFKKAPGWRAGFATDAARLLWDLLFFVTLFFSLRSFLHARVRALWFLFIIAFSWSDTAANAELGQIFRFNNHLRMSFFFLAFSFGIIFFIDLCSVLIKSSKYISPISIVEPKLERNFYNISLGP